MAWPEDRPVTYDANKYWDVSAQDWSTTRVTAPGSGVEYVLVIGDNSDVGIIYFRAV